MAVLTRKPVPGGTGDTQRPPYPTSPIEPQVQEPTIPQSLSVGHQRSNLDVPPQTVSAAQSSETSNISDDWVDAGLQSANPSAASENMLEADTLVERPSSASSRREVPDILKPGRLSTSHSPSMSRQPSREDLPPSLQIASGPPQATRTLSQNNPFRNRVTTQASLAESSSLPSHPTPDHAADKVAPVSPSSPQLPQLPVIGRLQISDDFRDSKLPGEPMSAETFSTNKTIDTPADAAPLESMHNAAEYQEEVKGSPYMLGNEHQKEHQDQFAHSKPSIEDVTSPTESIIDKYGTRPIDEVFQPPPGPPPSKATAAESTPKATQSPFPPSSPPAQSASSNIPPPLPARNQTSSSVTPRQRSETYQIKHIRWLDSRSPEIRTTPILTQNANGPCPLLALVNALTLSTPPNIDTALVETLRTRENISLGLLLDAVFDELMSGRRGDAAQELPDVGELYSFLITLHTGMNVNPRFIPTDPSSPNLLDLEPETSKPFTSTLNLGQFEMTREMKLYSTFAIPLIHGWLPPRSHAVYAALERSAPTYEDAQNLLFREEELDRKSKHDRLNDEEQRLFEDIGTIKHFLEATATQLTGFGLDSISEKMAPGSIAILFRNDHFSTLYKQPRTGQLLYLVTDQGYAGHDEIAWESLVDVTGEGSSFFSGDFRPVGNQTTTGASQAMEYPSTDNGEWTTVSRSGRRAQNNAVTDPASSVSAGAIPHHRPRAEDSDEQALQGSVSHSTEQEDADLALAMQLQEEEDDRSRRTAAQRAREDELSRQYLDSTQARNADRASNATGQRRHQTSSANSVPASLRAGPPSQVVRSLVPPRTSTTSTARRERNPEDGIDAPPPTYEQAARSEPYIPDPNAPSSPTAPARQPNSRVASSTTVSSNTPNTSSNARPNGPATGRPRGQSAYSQMQGEQPGGVNASNAGTRRPGASASRPSMGAVDAAGARHPRRRSQGVPMAYSPMDDDDRRDKDCIVM